MSATLVFVYLENDASLHIALEGDAKSNAKDAHYEASSLQLTPHELLFYGKR